jgi:hypothetical protein
MSGKLDQDAGKVKIEIGGRRFPESMDTFLVIVGIPTSRA